MSKFDHDELAHSLALHLKDDARMVWEDIPAGPSGSVRPDVYTMQKSFTNPNPITYEVKVSVSDFRSDVTKAKWKAYLDFSYGVVFAVPKGLITKRDLPNGCGLIQYNDKGIWHTIKKPTLSPCVIASDVLLKLLMGESERMTLAKPIENRDFEKWQHHETLRKKFGQNISEKISLIGDYPKMKKELEILKQELAKVLDISDSNHFNFERDAKYRIDKLKVMANETERKQAIATQLEGLKEQMSRQINRITSQYTS